GVIDAVAVGANGTVFAATPLGLFESADRGLRFDPIGGVPASVRHLAVAGERLIVATADGIYRLPIAAGASRVWQRISAAPAGVVDRGTLALRIAFVIALLVTAAFWTRSVTSGANLLHFDAKAHLVVARRTIDSLTPGWTQLGAVWLPLPHVLNALLAQND